MDFMDPTLVDVLLGKIYFGDSLSRLLPEHDIYKNDRQMKNEKFQSQGPETERVHDLIDQIQSCDIR